MEIFTHLWKVGEKRFFKSLPLAPFFTNFAALLALFTFSSAFAYVIVVVSRLAHPYHPPPESPRKASDPNRAIPPPAPHRRHVTRDVEPRSTLRFILHSFTSSSFAVIVVARTLLRRRHLRRRASVKGGPDRARRAQRRGRREGRTSLNKTTDHERSITPPTPKKKGLGHSIRQIHRSIIGGFIESKGNFPPRGCDRSIDLGIGTESGSGDRHLSCRERGME